jgi:oligopeptide transport system substrate-binding protein
MRWVVAVLVLDVAILAWLLAGRGVEDTADFVFISGGEHHWLDPQRISWRHDFRVAELLFETLVRYRLPEMEIESGVARTWEVSDDRRTYTFALRDDARWSNGDAVTAHDFIYAWRRALLPDFAADYAKLLFVVEGADAFFAFRSAQLAEYAARPAPQRTPEAAAALWGEAQAKFVELVGLSAPDDRTLVVRLHTPTPYFLELCAFATMSPVHAATVDEQVTINAATGLLVQDPMWTRPGRLISNGPYVLARRRYKRDLLMEANPHFHGRATIGPQSILERIVTDKQLQVLIYRSGGADYVPDVPSASPLAADLVAEGRSDVHVTPAAGTYFYSFNCQPTRPDGTPNPLHDVRVRRALALSIDRETIVKHVTRLNQPVARSFVPVGALAAYDPPVESGPGYDLAEARRLLEEAGYPGGRGLTDLSILFNTGHGHETIAQQIQRNWAEHLGVAVNLDGHESSVFGRRLRQQDYLIARAAWFGDYRDPSTFLDKFHSGGGNNDAKYDRPEYDALLAAAAAEPDPARRMAIFREAEAMLLEDAPIAVIFQYADVRLFDPTRVTNLPLNAWDFRRLELVRVAR